MAKEKTTKITLEEIKKLLEENKINPKDLEKLNELEKIKKKNEEIINLLDKFEKLLNNKKISSTKVDEILNNVIDILKNNLPKRKPKKSASDEKITEKNDVNNTETEETQSV